MPKCWAPFSLPADHDAKGIVVRVLNRKYYLRPFSLHFIDPYIEVEYNLSKRRADLQRVLVICALCVAICLGQVTSTIISMDPQEITKISAVDVRSVNIAVALVIALVSISIAGFVRFGIGTYKINWVYLHACLVFVALLVQEKIWLDFFVNVRRVPHALHSFSSHVADVNFKIKVSAALEVFYRSLPMLVLMINLVVCTLYTQVVSFIEYIVISGCYGTLTIAFSLYIETVVSGYFEKDGIVAYVQSGDGTNYTWVEELGVLKLGTRLRTQTIHIGICWCIVTASITTCLRANNMHSREIFILKRVRSDKDQRRVDEGGLCIQAERQAHEDTRDAEIVLNNIETWHRPATSSSADNVHGENTWDIVKLTIGEPCKQEESGGALSSAYESHLALNDVVVQAGYIPETRATASSAGDEPPSPESGTMA